MRRPWSTIVLLPLVASLCACGGTSSHRVFRLPSACGDVADKHEAERCAAWLVDEIMIGFLGVYEDPELLAYVARVGRAVAAESRRDDVDWTFRVLDDPGVQAWAGPGGHVYVTRGLLAQLDSEAQLAFVLAHEVGHVVAGHTDMMLDRLPEPSYAGSDFWEAFQLARDDEAQADQLAVRLIGAAGYDPRTARSALTAVARAARQREEPSWTDRHPPLPKRLAVTARAADGRSKGRRHAGRYLKRIEGLVVGHDPRHGLVIGDRFVHPRGGFSFALPDGWSHDEWEAGTIRTRLFTARSPDEETTLVLLPLESRHGDIYVEALTAELERSSTHAVELAGYDGVAGTVDTEQAREVHFAGARGTVHVVTFEARDGRSYGLILGATSGADTSTSTIYRELVDSFAREPTPRRAPRRLRLREVRERTTLTELAQAGCTPDGETDLIGLLNQRELDEVIEPGRTVKCIGS